MATKVEGLIGDKYELSRVLGRGAVGVVYAAKNLRTGRRVAIKSLQVRGVLDPQDPDLLRFEQEARIAGSLESQHIAQVLDIERDPATGLPFLVMELLRGEDLQALLDRVGPLPVDVALRIATQACAGLDAAHGAGVVHRDIKPGNLFLARREGGEVVVKILDFGIAKIRRLPPDASASAASGILAAPQESMTETGQLLGSPLYMSPEQVAGAKDIDARSDVFSLGVTLYAMVCGKAPHAGIKSFASLLQHLETTPPPPLREVAPWVPPEIAALVERATRIDRGERIPSAAALLESMAPFLSGGTALREDMLVGSGKVPAEEVKAHAESAPSAAAEGASDAKIAQSNENGPSWRWLIVISVAVALVTAVAVAAWLGR
ncbi:serine/threonine-protein kinase [Polyangium aurulentum]|uniref:serine/threonine-protein kinase n=1 Tax=Polyangium aurulentum TaxID=2567896 RepID=UPI0010AE72CA|nr:serine/threonine-protein kinase [Polyangium aurulentum]UQA60907.1 serine/threonine protein kinase [Polyangium aurulentum]